MAELQPLLFSPPAQPQTRRHSDATHAAAIKLRKAGYRIGALGRQHSLDGRAVTSLELIRLAAILPPKRRRSAPKAEDAPP